MKRMNTYVERRIAEKILGKRVTKKYFGDVEKIRVADLLMVLLRMDITEISSRRAVEIVGVTSQTLRNWLRKGKIQGRMESGKFYYSVESLLSLYKGDIVEHGGHKYRVLMVFSAPCPIGTGEVIEDSGFIKKVLKHRKIQYVTHVKKSKKNK